MLSLLLAALLQSQDEESLRVHIRLHEKVSPAVVGIRCGSQWGSGVLVHRDGWILTSLTSTGTQGDQAQIYLKGHKRVNGQVVHRDRDLELAILKIDPKQVQAVVALGDSDQAKLGQVCYVLGDTYRSIFTDDQVALTVGNISGLYELKSAKSNTFYKGPVIETSAAVNPNSDGGALVDADGRLIGIISLNYHEAKFTGVAIPVNRLKATLEKQISGYAPPVWLGAEFEGVTVKRVSKNGPAEKAGILEGDKVVKLNGKEVTSPESLDAAVKTCRPGQEAKIEVQRGTETKTLTLTPVEKDFY